MEREDEERLIYIMSFTLLFFMVLSFIALVSGQRANYGRYWKDEAFGMRCTTTIHGTVAWVVQEMPALLLPVICLIIGDRRATPNVVLVSYYIVHYFQRTLIFPLLIKGGKPTPVTVMLAAFVFTSMTGYMIGRDLTYCSDDFPEAYLWSPQFIIGSVLFFTGMAVNIHSDHILRNLRKPGETSYKIPRGGLFEWVSGANFTGEIVEWTGFAIATNGLLPAVCFAINTALNIGPRAVQHHNWYLEKFKDEYAQLNRKALIPYLL